MSPGRLSSGPGARGAATPARIGQAEDAEEEQVVADDVDEVPAADDAARGRHAAVPVPRRLGEVEVAQRPQLERGQMLEVTSCGGP